MKKTLKPDLTNRRSFLKTTGTAMLGGALVYNLGFPSEAFANRKKTLKIGLIGCGGRGTGAALQALKADPDVIITALGDAFEDRLEGTYKALIQVAPDQTKIKHKFIGFDAYQKVIDSGVDVVLLATPPAFRPDHLTYAVNAGKHIFCEKPVAVDAPGVRKVLAAAKLAKDKNLSLVSGFCFRHDFANMATFSKIINGEIGDIKTVTTFRNGGELSAQYSRGGEKGIAHQLRNWYYQNWLSGDMLTEQAVHSIDMMSWAMNDQLPVKAIGTGGRQVRVGEEFGNIYDHFAIEYQYANGAKGFHFCRQQSGTTSRNTVEVAGTKGDASMTMGRSHIITGQNPWEYTGEKNNMFQTEHDILFASIRSGKPFNDGERMANSTMIGILGTLAAYTGQEVNWEQAFNSEHSIGPNIADYNWDLEWKNAPIAVPGITKLL
jgi:myo-inositol 2-dehydrogenase/D-chiro-inositol 1-dehydrogenase